MTDATLGAMPLPPRDELESPARRALRRLFKRKGAVVGPGRDRAVRPARGLRAADRALRSDRDQLDRGPQAAVARCTGSAPTRSAATCSPA